jgi:hypothetical protein
VRLAKLDWDASSKPEHAARLKLVRDLLAARKAHIVPRLPHLADGHGTARFDDGVMTAVWGGMPAAELPPWSVFAWIGAS